MGILANSVKIGVLLSAAGPVAAQSAREQPRVVTMPDGRTVYVVPAQRGDTRTKQPPVSTVVAPAGRTIYGVEQKPQAIGRATCREIVCKYGYMSVCTAA